MKQFELEVLQRAMRFCAYRERAEIEVLEKLHDWEISKALSEKIIEALKEENFLNNQRFAIGFAQGKFRNNNWGRLKIEQHLQAKEIEEKHIVEGLASINQEEYEQKLYRLMHSKYKTTKAKNTFELRRKIAEYLMRKGFEGDEVWDLVKAEIKD